MSGADPFLLQFIKKCLKFGNLHPQVETWKKYLLLVPLCLDIAFMLVCAIMKPVIHQDIDALLGAMEAVPAYYQALIKLIIFNRYLKHLGELLKIVEEHFWPLDKFTVELGRKLKRQLYIVYVGLIMYFVFLISTSCIIFFKGILTGQPLFMIYEFVDFDKLPNMLMVYFLQTFVIVPCSVLVVGVDGSFLSLVALTCTQLELLQFAFANLQLNTIETEEDEQECFRKLIAYIAHHKMILKFAEDVHEIFSFLIFNQFCISTISICASQYLSMTGSQVGNIQLLRYGSLGLTLTLQMFVYCYIGQQITDTSAQISLAAYNSPWYEQKINSRVTKALRMVMIRSQIPVVLRAGGMYDLNFVNFLAIMKLSFSIFTLLQSFRQE